MNPELKQKWIEALRSGKYQQTREVLRESGLFCCLGVLCDVAAPDEWDGDGNHSWRSEDGGFLGDDALSFVGLTDKEQEAIIEMNDGGVLKNTPPHSFTEIADYIEANL